MRQRPAGGGVQSEVRSTRRRHFSRCHDPGKISRAEAFRIGCIGHVFPENIDRLFGYGGEAVGKMGLR